MPNPKSSKAEELRAPKGMRDLIAEEVFLFQGFFEKAAELALYYGFKPIDTPILEKEELFVRGLGESTDVISKEIYNLRTKGGDRLVLRPEGTAGVMRSYMEHGMFAQPQPLMFYYSGPFFRHDNPQRGRYRQLHQFGLEILGTPKSIADATIINLTKIILEEAGFTNLNFKINSIGDSECRGNFRRDLVSYYKKNLKNLCSDCKERLKTNPLRLLDCKNPNCIELKKDAPDSIGYLCSSCKSHFKEVLEYLDALNISYEVDNTLVRGLDYYTRTVFEVFAESKNEEGESLPLALAGGGRYDNLSKTLGFKKDVPAVGVSLGADRIIELPEYIRHAPRIVKKPKVFFIQLSFDAKLKSFEIIEALRHAKIPVKHSLSKDSLSAQLALAEKIGVPYTIILGQKEALDGTVIVRNMDTRSQDTIKIAKLAEYLKKIK
ncbi:MAG TPA: histidine--tRNA ligase [Candidatus Paceibacterota bacterium]|nr:histidine--tRNA ligase [Candidatus Paceibacterota bacterium]